MKKYVLWPLLAAIGGVGAFLLRLLQRSTGFEVDTGLPIPGNLYAILLVAWFVVLAAVCLLVARPLLPADREDPPLFPTGFSVASPGLLTPAVMGLFLLTASGVLDLLFGFSGASALTGSGETVTVFGDRPGQSALLRQGASGGGSAVSSLGGQPASRCACLPHPAGGRGAQALSESSAAGARLLPSGAAGADLPGGVRRPVPHRLLHGAAGGGVPGSGLLPAVLLRLPGGADPPLRRLCGAGHRLLPGHSGGPADPARLLFYLGGAVTLFGFLLQRTAVLAAPWDNT